MLHSECTSWSLPDEVNKNSVVSTSKNFNTRTWTLQSMALGGWERVTSRPGCAVRQGQRGSRCGGVSMASRAGEPGGCSGKGLMSPQCCIQMKS